MNILYDLLPTQPTKKNQVHGGGKYAKIVFMALAEYVNKRPDVQLFVLMDGNRAMDEEIGQIVAESSVRRCDITQSSLEKMADHHRIDTFYSALPEGISHTFPGMNCRVLCTIHGLRVLEWDMEWRDLAYYRGKKMIKMAVKIPLQNVVRNKIIRSYKKLFQLDHYSFVTVSGHSKYAICTQFDGIDPERVHVFYSPDVTGKLPGRAVSKKSSDGGSEKIFLMVSGSIPVKNNLRAAKALDELITAFPNLPLKGVITGVSHPDLYLRRLKNKNRFQVLGYVSEEKLQRLYSEAFAFVYPTLNEGFGYPPLEAMHAGTPVISSPFASIPEVCGDSVLYANPYSVLELKSRMYRLITNPDFYEDLVKKGYERYAFIKEKQDKDLRGLVEYIVNYGSRGNEVGEGVY